MVSFRQAEQASMKALEDRREKTRQDFFKGRQDVSNKRLDNRQIQADLLEKYKQDLVRQGKYMKTASGEPVRTASGDYVYTGTSYFDTDSSSPTFGRHVTYGVTDKMEELARKYGPKLKDIFSDIGYATGSMAKGLAEKGTPMMQLGKAVLGGIQNFFSPKPPVATYGGSSDISVREIPLVNSDLNVSVNPGARPEFLAAINNPGTMAQDSRLQELLMKNVPGYERIMGLGNTPYGKFGIENLLNDPRFLYEKNLGPGQLGIQVNPFSQSGGFSYGMRFKNGGIATLN